MQRTLIAQASRFLILPALAGALAFAQSQSQAQAAPAVGQHAATQAQQASPATSWARQQALRASRVIGSSVRNPQGQDIGQVEDMVVNLADGRARYVVLRFDPGWLQLERVYAVPVEKLRMIDEQVVIDLPRERLERSGIEHAGWSRDYFDDRARIARLDTDWGLGMRGPEQLVRASDLMGSRIVSAATGERIGRIEEVVFAPGRQQVQYVVVEFDRSWLGANKRAAIDIRSLHRRTEADTLALAADRHAVQGMRPFYEDRYAATRDLSFINHGGRGTTSTGGGAAEPQRATR